MNVIDQYYTLGGKNAEGQEETPHLTSEVKVYFEIRCAMCNTGLCKRIVCLKTPRRKQNVIMVEPCRNCLAVGGRVEINSEYQQEGEA